MLGNFGCHCAWRDLLGLHTEPSLKETSCLCHLGRQQSDFGRVKMIGLRGTEYQEEKRRNGKRDGGNHGHTSEALFKVWTMAGIETKSSHTVFPPDQVVY